MAVEGTHTSEAVLQALATLDEQGIEVSEHQDPAPPEGAIYHGIATHTLTSRQSAALTDPAEDTQLEVLPTGEVYMSQGHYRRRLNVAFGPGAWALRPLGPPVIVGITVMREYALYAGGRFLSQSMGEADYQENNPRMSYASALEACKSNALTRCCKDLGIASECWDWRFTARFLREHCVQVWRKDRERYPRPQWRLKDKEAWFDETGVVTPKEAAQATSENQAPARQPAQPQAPRQPRTDRADTKVSTAWWKLVQTTWPNLARDDAHDRANAWCRQLFGGRAFHELGAHQAAEALQALQEGYGLADDKEAVLPPAEEAGVPAEASA